MQLVGDVFRGAYLPPYPKNARDLYLEEIIRMNIGGQSVFRRLLFGLILMDYQLPDMTGMALTGSVLLYKPGTRILALSNYAEADYVTSMIEAGAKGYILKNVEPYELKPDQKRDRDPAPDRTGDDQ
ncbi:MAG: response regulator transcription factor [Ilumatobacteraceae bacterium]